MPGDKKKTQTVVRDAGDGRFVKKEEAKRRPKTTVKEQVRRGKR